DVQRLRLADRAIPRVALQKAPLRGIIPSGAQISQTARGAPLARVAEATGGGRVLLDPKGRVMAVGDNLASVVIGLAHRADRVHAIPGAGAAGLLVDDLIAL